MARQTVLKEPTPHGSDAACRSSPIGITRAGGWKPELRRAHTPSLRAAAWGGDKTAGAAGGGSGGSRTVGGGGESGLDGVSDREGGQGAVGEREGERNSVNSLGAGGAVGAPSSGSW